MLDRRKTRFLTLWYSKKRIQNVHLIKDFGIIPYTLHKNYNYDAKVAFAKDGEYPYEEQEVKGLKIDFIKQIMDSDFLNAFFYILKNARDYDVLNLYHYSLKTSIIAIFYKLINQRGILYLKLDCNLQLLKDIKKDGSLKRKIHETAIWIVTNNRCLITAEIKEVCRTLKKFRFPQIKYITNGVYFKERKAIDFTLKRNEILFVGRIGAKEKNIETLLKAFCEVYKQLPDWNLVLVGPVEEKECDFQKYLEELFCKNPEMIERVKITGNIEDREVLMKYYESAKIFCLTSLHESFGIVLVEAMSRGTYIISTDILSSREITKNGKYGALFPIKDYKKLSELLVSIGHNEDLLKNNCEDVQDYIYENYNWEKICDKLDGLIQEEVRKVHEES